MHLGTTSCWLMLCALIKPPGHLLAARPPPLLIDGRVIKVGTERFQAPEALFTPGLPVIAVGAGLSTFDKTSVHYYVQSHIQMNEYRDCLILTYFSILMDVRYAKVETTGSIWIKRPL